MTEAAVKDILSAIYNSKTPEEVDAQFAALDADTRKEVVKKLQDKFVRIASSDTEDLWVARLELLLNIGRDSAANGPQQMMTQAIFHISNDLKEEAHPVINAFAAAAKKQNEMTYGTQYGFAEAYLAAREEVKVLTKPRNNPFR